MTMAGTWTWTELQMHDTTRFLFEPASLTMTQKEDLTKRYPHQAMVDYEFDPFGGRTHN